MFQFFHVILTFCVFEDAKSAFSHLLHIILLEMISLAPLPNSLSFSTDLQFQALNSCFLQSPESSVKAGNKRGAPSAYGVATFLPSKSGRTPAAHELPRAALPASSLLVSPSLVKLFNHTL